MEDVVIDIKEGTRPEQPPKIVLALAASTASEKVPNPTPIKWRMSRKIDEGEGMIVIIFEHGPTLMFDEAQIKAVEFPPKFPAPIIHTNEEAQEVVETLAPTRKPNPKKEKPNAAHPPE
jgi:hypothetical protein